MNSSNKIGWFNKFDISD